MIYPMTGIDIGGRTTDGVRDDVLKDLARMSSSYDLNQLKSRVLGKSGVVASAFQKLKSEPVEVKKTLGPELNGLKIFLERAFLERAEEIELGSVLESMKGEDVDISLPSRPVFTGSVSLLTSVIYRLLSILGDLGFGMAEGSEIEDDSYNFSLLNFVEDHPARQMHDTFYVRESGGMNLDSLSLLRTHTSSVQARVLGESKSPLAFVSYGKTYRCDSDRTHSPMFHQMEGVCIDENVSFAGLKWIVEHILSEFFEGVNFGTRFRPSFFPFTEPSAEVDIDLGNGWLEVMGCGVIHPNVLRNCGVSGNGDAVRGIAFGLGVERFAMLKYGISDLRGFFGSTQFNVFGDLYA